MKPGTPPLQSSRLLGQVRERIRYMHYGLATEKVYVYWVRFFVRWSGRAGAMRHPSEIDAKGVEAFLTMLVSSRLPVTVNAAINRVPLRSSAPATETRWASGRCSCGKRG